MDPKQAECIALHLIRKYLSSHGEWVFQFDNALKRFGYCRFRFERTGIRKVSGKFREHAAVTGGVISLSKPLTELNSEAQVRNTILHEIAHALCGPFAGHSETWRSMARKIGCDAARCYDPEIVVRPPPIYIGICPGCRHQSHHNSKRKISCGRCDDKFNPAFRLKFHKNPEASCPPSSAPCTNGDTHR